VEEIAMSATHKSTDDEEPVVIDRAFIRVQATKAAVQFFRPLVAAFEQVGPNHYAVRTKPQDEPR
jgi:hypothetical protein